MSRPMPPLSTKQHTTSAAIIFKCSTRLDHCTSRIINWLDGLDLADPREQVQRAIRRAPLDTRTVRRNSFLVAQPPSSD